jgi:methionyl-tRNA formyltransferase
MTPRYAWIGAHAEGLAALDALLDAGAPIVAVFTLTPERAARRSGSVDYRAVCARHGVPLIPTTNVNDADTVRRLEDLDLDLLFVIGWSQILRPAALRAARFGAIGAHASLLPANRGSAPVNWAIIRGERRGGNSLIWLADDVDAGAVIDQTEFCITPYDTCATVYAKVTESNREMLLRVLPRLLAGERPGRPQPATAEPVLPRRRPADGAIDWRREGRAVYDFVRALTRPYPGAFGHLDGRRWTVWQAALLPPPLTNGAVPGQVIGPVISPEPAACGLAVQCHGGGVVLLEVENDDGVVLRGPALAEQPWTGKQWSLPDG